MTEDTIRSVLRNAIERADAELPGVKLKHLSPDESLFGGKGSALDSLSLVSFIFIMEEEFKKATGKAIQISTQDILSKEETPFRDLTSLEAWLRRKASEHR